MNKRSSSDFYHAAPVTRAALFISLFAAVVFWVIVSVLVSAAVSVTTCLCLSEYIQLSTEGVGILLLNAVVGALAVAACVALAMSITGTLFNNVVVAGLIFFAPRLILLVCHSLVQSNVHILSGNTDSILLDVNYNIPLGLLMSVFSIAGPVPILHSVKSTAYTAVLAFLYFMSANLLVRLRKSEAAGNAATTPILQHIYRLLITFIVTLWPVSIIFSNLFNGETDRETVFTICVLYIVAAVAFCVYELITVKKPKRLLKVAPTFLLVLAADGVMIVGLLFGCRSLLAYRPAADEITGVSLVSDGSHSYFTARSEDTVLRDAEIYEIVSARLKACAESNSLQGGFAAGKEGLSMTVRIYSGSRAHERRITVSDAQLSAIKAVMGKTEGYQKAFTLPKRDSTVSPGHWSLTAKETQTLYDTMYRESQDLSFEQMYGLLIDAEYPRTLYTFTEISVDVSYHNKIYSFVVPLDADYFPESYALYLSYRYQDTADMQDELLQKLRVEEVHIEAYDNGSEPAEQRMLSSGELSTEAASAFANGLIRKAPTGNDSFCRLWYEEFDGRDYVEKEAFFTLSPEAVQALRTVQTDERIDVVATARSSPMK